MCGRKGKSLMARSALALQPVQLVHVLLVEDNASDAFLVDSLMEESPHVQYKTHPVTTQAEALAELERQAFDVCLLDLTLPDANGFSALIDIQKSAPDMPVLILTGVNDMALAKGAVGRGAQDYLLKDELGLTGLIRAIDYAIERKRVEKELFQRANCDALTGLANREMFQSRLAMAVARTERSGLGIAVLFIDLDGFKPINDAHGHDAGDVALKTVANRIKATLRPYDAAARFGGDEFAVLLEGISNPRDAASIAQKIVRALLEPMPYQSSRLELGASVGIAFSHEAATPEALLQYADTAMYHAKKAGGGYRFYTDSMHKEAAARLDLEEDLRTALEADELRMVYQPCVAPDGKTVAGVESLLRWMHPERGLLCAHEFLSAAEAARLMPQVARWMCRQMYRDIAVWNAHALAPLAIAVNLSGSQLDAPELAQWLAPLARADFLGEHRLAVEISERELTQVSEARILMLAKLNAMGIGLQMDHFCCGALPLATLHSLPFSLLKLDLTLITSMDDVLIGAAIMLAHHLGMKAGAVGVETQWQAQRLQAQSCDLMQGFFTAQPMTAQALVEWLAQPTGRAA